MLRRYCLTASVLAWASLAAHASAPPDWPITVQGAGPYYQLTLPIAAYGRSSSSALDDLRVRNAAGQAIAFAWVRSNSTDTKVPTTATRAVPLFALPPTGAGSPADDAPAFVIRANGTLQPVKKMAVDKAAVTQWLVDTRAIRGRLLQAHFELAPRQTGVFAVQMEASNDLQHWRTLGGPQPLVRLQHEQQTIERLTINLGGIQTQFVRVRAVDSNRSLPIARVTIDGVDDVQAPPVLQWTDDLPPTQCGADYCDYTVPSGAPVNHIQVQLAQANTLAPIRLYGVADANTAQAQPLRKTHNPLYALHTLRHPLRHPHHASHRTAPGDQLPSETLLADGLVYRLTYPQGEVVSAALHLSGSAWKTLRLRTQGPISTLGTSPPRLSLAVPLQTLVFLGQGERPYSVATADRADAKAFAAGAPMALPKLMPHYTPAVLSTLEQAIVAVPSVAALAAQATAPAPPAAQPLVSRRVWLWLALGLGLVLLAGMAWSLLRSVKTGGAPQG